MSPPRIIVFARELNTAERVDFPYDLLNQFAYDDEIVASEGGVLLLPGADTWNDPKHGAILKKASESLSLGATVCAICGATAALANFGLLDQAPAYQ